jgi:hypothetical protein
VVEDPAAEPQPHVDGRVAAKDYPTLWSVNAVIQSRRTLPRSGLLLDTTMKFP